MSWLRPWFSSAGWKALAVAIRRSRHDVRARKNLFRLLLSLGVGAIYFGWYGSWLAAFILHDTVGRVMFLVVVCVMVLLGYGGAVFYRWDERRQERRTPSVPSDVRAAIYREAFLLATLLQRLGSEVALEKEMPPGIEVITRRVLLDRLEAQQLRADLSSLLLDVLLMPDGHWTHSLKSRAHQAWECFEVLYWVLGRGELSELTSAPKYNYADARALIDLKNPERLSVLPAWDIRPARNQADVFFSRCWSELIARKEVNNASDEDVSYAIEKRAEIQEVGYTQDFLVGFRTIPELPSPELWFTVVRSFHRWQVLSLLVDITSGGEKVAELRSLYSTFFELTDETAEPAAVTN